MGELETINLLVQIVGVSATAIAAVVGVNSYINSNKRAEEARRRELETRQAQLFMQLFAQYDNRDFMIDYAKIAYEMEYENLTDWMKKYGPNEAREYYASWTRVGRFFDGVGILVRKGLIDVDLVIEELRELILFSWDKMRPWVIEVRAEMKSPHTWENFEYLAEEARGRHGEVISASDWNVYAKRVLGESI